MKRPEDIKVEELIPQRPPMVMIDRLVKVEGRTATSELEVRDENIFLEKGLFSESGVLENIAQTAAAMNGYDALVQGKAVKNGYIGGIKDLEFHALPAKGDLLVTRVVETHHVMGASVLQGSCHSGGRLIASCEMKVFMEE